MADDLVGAIGVEEIFFGWAAPIDPDEESLIVLRVVGSPLGEENQRDVTMALHIDTAAGLVARLLRMADRHGIGDEFRQMVGDTELSFIRRRPVLDEIQFKRDVED